jgi:hypothetical protein
MHVIDPAVKIFDGRKDSLLISADRHIATKHAHVYLDRVSNDDYKGQNPNLWRRFYRNLIEF